MSLSITPAMINIVMDGVNAIFVAVVIPIAIQWINTHVAKDRRATMENALNGALKASISAETAGKGAGDTLRAVMLNPDVRSAIVTGATDYLQQNVPGIIKKLDISDGLAKIVEARIDDVAAEVAKNYTIANTAISTANSTAADAIQAGLIKDDSKPV